jgi:hypothetical protein
LQNKPLRKRRMSGRYEVVKGRQAMVKNHAVKTYGGVKL